MSGFSNVVLMGNLTRDPELRYTSAGKAVCSLTVAISRKFGEREDTAFIDCTIWNNAAETVAKHFTKGKPIIIRGELTQDEWEDRETGKRRTKLKVTANGFSFIPRESREEQPGRTGSARRATPREDSQLEDAGDGSDVPF